MHSMPQLPPLNCVLVLMTCSSPIIKRRIAWVIGRWVSEDCASPNNDLIWRVLLHLLSDSGPGTDSVVRFTAAKALKDCVDVKLFLYLVKSGPKFYSLDIDFQSRCFPTSPTWCTFAIGGTRL